MNNTHHKEMKTKQILYGFLLCYLTAAYTACTQKQTQTPETTAQTSTETTTDDDNQYTDFALPGMHNNLVRVSDYVKNNKYTLIDFWASWCGPCRAEMPTVVKAYADYHTKGLEVIGVSLDNNHDAWVKAVNDLRMTWPQMSDLKGWECAGAQLYNVQAIPANVLVDQQGRMIAKDLRGSELLDKMAELLN